MQKHKYLLKPDVRKISDQKYRDFFLLKELPEFIDYRKKMPPIWNQGDLGSCQSHAIDAIDAYIKGYSYTPSHLFTYYNVRLIEGTVDQDSGGTLSDTCEAIKNNSVCDAEIWPYDISKFAEKPPEQAYANAKSDNDAIYHFYRAQSVDEARQALADGHIPLIGIVVYENFETEECLNTGIIPDPNGKILGGHALDIVGYYDNPSANSTFLSCIFKKSQGYFIIRNSWGTGIGLNGSGYFRISYEVFEKLLMDMWIIID